MRHFNGNILCAIDIETNGLQAGYHEILEIGIIPLDYKLDPIKEILPFNIKMRPNYPERTDPEALKINKLDLADIMLRGFDSLDAIHAFETWKNKLGLRYTHWGREKRLIPLGHNVAQFDIPFVQAWLGKETYDLHFDRRCRDTMITAAYINDRLGMWGESVMFNKYDLAWLCKTLAIKRCDAHTALGDAMDSINVYRTLLKMDARIAMHPTMELQDPPVESS